MGFGLMIERFSGSFLVPGMVALEAITVELSDGVGLDTSTPYGSCHEDTGKVVLTLRQQRRDGSQAGFRT